MITVRCAARGIFRSCCHKGSTSHSVRNLTSSAEKGAASSKWSNTATTTSIAAAAAAVLTTGYFGSTALAQSPKQDPHLSIEKPPAVWDRWDQVKNFLFSWRKTIRGGGNGADVPLPTDKLACHLSAAKSGITRPIVLVSCGSFNPPTTMHVRMLELARQELFARGHDVLGAYLSPVNDAYWKRDLAPGRHRVQMCLEATSDSDFIMVDAWEVEQQQYTRTLHVLQHLEKRLCQLFQATSTKNNSTTSSSAKEKDEAVPALPKGCPPSSLEPRTMLVCGADVVESMADVSLWKQDLLEILLKNHGVVCITRDGAGANAAWLLSQPGTLLYQYRDNVILLQDPVPNEISSSAVRRELKEGRSVKYLLAPAVEGYIRKHGLYGSGVKNNV
ncbi:hypothetical protein Ndes2437B_g09097 [Nannochloris sp. 'desiccata']